MRGELGALMAVAILAGAALPARAAQYQVRGLVLKVDASSHTLVVSHDRIPGFMEAMTMAFEVRDASELKDLTPGAIVEFTLHVGERTAYAERVRVVPYESVEQDPRTARRLAVLKRAAGFVTRPLALGERVPEFSLVDQTGRTVTLSSLHGKVVALNFIYTRCALPQFCVRVTNDFAVLQKRFASRLGKDLMLVTITFDPQRDSQNVLAGYARRWNADASVWHFLTGPVDAVRRLCAHFGLESFPDEGLMNHSLRTALIDRRGRLVASIEGNAYTPGQLGDLVATALGP